LFKLTTIPIYDTLGDENITYVFKHCSLKCCFVDDGGLKALKKTHDLDQLKYIVSFDALDADSIKYFE
jgi:long-subunit acyl-CoA synthetase (AMP-forming)